MAMEGDVNKKISQLEENKDIAGLEEIKNDAELNFEGETVGLVEQAIARINSKVEEITPKVETTESQKTQAENMGGTESGLQEATKPVDEKIAEKDTEIKNVENDTKQKIEEVKESTSENTQDKTKEISPEGELKNKFSSLLEEEKSLLSKGSLDEDQKKRLQEIGNQKGETILNFKKLYGYEEINNLPNVESVNKSNDATRIALNKYLGLDLPVFSKDLKTFQSQDNKLYIDLNKDENRKILAEKQISFFKKIKEANTETKKLTEEQKTEIRKELELEKAAFNEINNSVSERPTNNTITEVFYPYIKEYNRASVILTPEDKYYPKDIKDFNGQPTDKEKVRELLGGKAGIVAINQLLLMKKAKEKGWI